MPPASSHRSIAHWLGTIGIVVLGTVLASAWLQTCLSSRLLALNFVSSSTWLQLAKAASPSAPISPDLNSINVPFGNSLIWCGTITLISWLGGSGWLVWRRGLSWADAMIDWGFYGWLWWCLIDVWEWLWIASDAMGWTSLSLLLAAAPQFWLAGCLAGWMTTWATVGAIKASNSLVRPETVPVRWLWLVCALYFVTFTTMNWRMYFNLLIPHGDSAMYEEHLWNLLHGKGFRSYLDRGLFFGEHIQFVHLFLLPLYVIWPSHLLLEACSSAALACGAFPVFWMVRRHTGSDRAAFAAAVAYLLYTPMQYLDIEIDLKTFRPESFGIPLLLLTLDQLDRRSVVGTLIGILMCLTVKEDYAIVFGPLGLWIACNGFGRHQAEITVRQNAFSNFRTRLLFGIGLSIFSVGYLWLATRVIMPWFRSGDEVHFASYFDRFGKTPEEILRTMLTRPGLVVEALATLGTTLYAIALLAPLAFIPLLAPARLAVGLPLFMILCLVKLDDGRPPTPQHQFHAPLVAIAFWALAAGLPRAMRLVAAVTEQIRLATTDRARFAAVVCRNLIWTSSLATGIFFTFAPLGLSFWDAGSRLYWGRLSGTSQRAMMFERIAHTIPTSSRVASTDFVHPRFTHYERSYDYSDYYRKINEQGQRVPVDTEYLVIDTQHEYSQIKLPSEVPELRDQPGRWELVPDTTDGYFIVLKRTSKDEK